MFKFFNTIVRELSSYNLLVLLFFLPIFIFTNCVRWSERPKSTTAVPNTGISLYVMITSIRDSVEGVVLVGDLTVFIIL